MPSRSVVGIRRASEEVALAQPAIELLRTKSFARCTPDELAELAELMRAMRLAVPTRRTRRREPRAAGRPDLRRTLRRSFRTGGEPLERAWRARRRRRGGSCSCSTSPARWRTTRARSLMFAHAALRADAAGGVLLRHAADPRDARARRRRPDEALRARGRGGGRLGRRHADRRLKAFLDATATRLARGAVVVICSDGLDVGDPELLREQMARLARLAHRVMWLNPLKEDPAYEPLARGMQAALPHVDVFLSGHNLASLEAAGEALYAHCTPCRRRAPSSS